MTPVPAGVCSQGHHSHNTSHTDWRHNPETADQQSQLQLQRLGTQKQYLLPSLSSVSSQFKYNYEEISPHPFSFPSHQWWKLVALHFFRIQDKDIYSS